MKLGVSSAAFPQLTPTRLIEELGRLGYGGAEWRVADVAGLDPGKAWHHRKNNRATVAPTERAMREIRAACADAGLTIFGLSPYLPVGDVDAACAALDLAVAAGTDRVRVWAPRTGEETYSAAYDRFLQFLDRLGPEAEARGVRLALEVHHGTICPSASLTMRVAARFSPRQVCVIYDVGNLAVEGYEDPRIALELIGEHLAHVQLKNATLSTASEDGFTWLWSPLDQGVLPLRRIVAQLGSAGFGDWLSCEDFSTTYSDAEKLRIDKDLLDTYTKALIDS